MEKTINMEMTFYYLTFNTWSSRVMQRLTFMAATLDYLTEEFMQCYSHETLHYLTEELEVKYFGVEVTSLKG